jgi:solute:Na+ symporter, SSS family
VDDRWVPLVAILAPVCSVILDQNSERWFNGYSFGYDILVVNSLIAWGGLYILSFLKKKDKDLSNSRILKKAY